MTKIIIPTNTITSVVFILSNQASIDKLTSYIGAINATFAIFNLRFCINTGPIQSISFTKDELNSGAALTMFNAAIADFVKTLTPKS